LSTARHLENTTRRFLACFRARSFSVSQVLNNEKDCLDLGLGEIRILSRLGRTENGKADPAALQLLGE